VPSKEHAGRRTSARCGSAKDELVKLATRLIVEEALEGEAGDAVGRDYYAHGAQPRQGPGAKREPVLAAWGYTVEGRRVLLHLMAGSKEDAETVTAFFEDMKMRGSMTRCW
jgi:transposase-like protein